MSSIIYSRVRQLCDEAGMSIAKLESELNFSYTTIAKWKNTSSPTIDKIARVAAYFHVSIDYLVGASDIRSTADDLTGDPDYISIQRARERMNERDKERMMAILRIGFDFAFADENSRVNSPDGKENKN